MELKITRQDNKWSVVYYADEAHQAGQSYQPDNTDELLGKVVNLIINWFKSPEEMKSEEKV